MPHNTNRKQTREKSFNQKLFNGTGTAVRAVEELEIVRLEKNTRVIINKTEEYSTIRLSPEKMTIKCRTNLERSELNDNSRAQALLR